MSYIKKNIFSILFLSILVIAFVFLVSHVFHVFDKEKQKAKLNYIALTEEMQDLKTENGELAHQIHVLEFTNNEATQVVIPELRQELENLRIKLKRTKSFSKNIIELRDTIKIELRDTIILSDIANNIEEKELKYFDYADSFTKIQGFVGRDTVSLDYAIQDTIVQVVHRGRHKNWYDGFLFRKRPLLQTIYTKNPKTHLTYSRTINIR